MARRASLRASDADRDRIAEQLRRAAAEGRLLAHELEERLATALRARTYGELDALVSDLPHGAVEPRRPTSARRWIVPTVALALAIPVALAAVAMILFLVASLVTIWAAWLFIAWWFLGHRGRFGPGYGRFGPGRGRSRRVGVYGPRRPQARTGFWL